MADQELLREPLKNFGIRNMSVHYLYSFPIADHSSVLFDPKNVKMSAEKILNKLKESEEYRYIDISNRISYLAISQIYIKKFIEYYCPKVFKYVGGGCNGALGEGDLPHSPTDITSNQTSNYELYIYPKLGICICEFTVNVNVEQSYSDIISNLRNEKKDLEKQVKEIIENKLGLNKGNSSYDIIDLFRITEIKGSKYINEFSDNEKRVLAGLTNLSDRFPWYTEETIKKILSKNLSLTNYEFQCISQKNLLLYVNDTYIRGLPKSDHEYYLKYLYTMKLGVNILFAIISFLKVLNKYLEVYDFTTRKLKINLLDYWIRESYELSRIYLFAYTKHYKEFILTALEEVCIRDYLRDLKDLLTMFREQELSKRLYIINIIMIFLTVLVIILTILSYFLPYQTC